MSDQDLTIAYSSGVESPENAPAPENPGATIQSPDFDCAMDVNDIGEFRSDDGYVTKIVAGIKKQIGETIITSRCLEIPIPLDISTNAERDSDEWVLSSKQWIKLALSHPDFDSLIEELKEKELNL